MQKDILGVALLALFSVSCSSVGEPRGYSEKDIYYVCRPEEFASDSAAVHFFPISEPIMVRQIRGKITYQDWEGSWGDDLWPILKLRGPGKSSKTYEVRGDATGRLVLRNLPEGRYCFVASASGPGYHGAYGIIIIDRKADPKKEIEIVLPPGAP